MSEVGLSHLNRRAGPFLKERSLSLYSEDSIDDIDVTTRVVGMKTLIVFRIANEDLGVKSEDGQPKASCFMHV